MKKIRLGIIGCGIAANKIHLPALQKLSAKFEITAVCNRTTEKAVSFAQKAGNVPYYLDYRDLLAREDIEAVDIVLPIHLNCQVALDSLKAGKHVLLEKPLAANRKEASRLVAAEKNMDLVTMVAENFRFRPGLHWLKNQLENDAIGTPYAFFWNIFLMVDEQNPYAQTGWRIRHKYRGGFILDGGIHNIAAIRFLFGEIDAPQALIKSVNKKIGKVDSFSLHFTIAQKMIGTLNIFLSTTGFNENRILILGSQGSVTIQDGVYTTFRNGKSSRKRFDNDNGYVEELDEFYAAVRQGKQNTSNFRTAEEDLRTMLAILDTARMIQ